MKVTVVDRAEASRNWGRSSFIRLPIKTVEMADTCPVCGGPRGEPRGFNFYESGETYWVNVWDNRCGHRDSYRDVLKEAVFGDGE